MRFINSVFLSENSLAVRIPLSRKSTKVLIWSGIDSPVIVLLFLVFWICSRIIAIAKFSGSKISVNISFAPLTFNSMTFNKRDLDWPTLAISSKLKDWTTSVIPRYQNITLKFVTIKYSLKTPINGSLPLNAAISDSPQSGHIHKIRKYITTEIKGRVWNTPTVSL